MLVIILSFAAIKEQLDNLKTLMGLKGQDTQAFNKSKENGTTVYSNLAGPETSLCRALWPGLLTSEDLFNDFRMWEFTPEQATACTHTDTSPQCPCTHVPTHRLWQNVGWKLPWSHGALSYPSPSQTLALGFFIQESKGKSGKGHSNPPD